jgi:hypothetical protein
MSQRLFSFRLCLRLCLQLKNACTHKMAARQRYIAKFKEAVENQDAKSFAACFALDELAAGPLAREIKDVSLYLLADCHWCHSYRLLVQGARMICDSSC